jgi:outer membrane lipoprotein SlyB
MRTTLIAAAALIALGLAGCSSFKLGSAMYCAYGKACSMQSMPVKPAAPAASAPAAKVLHAGM